MFNRGGFNNLGFNERASDFHVEKTDEVNVQAQDNASQKAEVSSSDDLNIVITEASYISLSTTTEEVVLTTDKSIDIYRETSGLDPPKVTISEATNINNEIEVSDELLVTDKFYLPLGFNQQGFNQSQDRYFEESEKTTRDKFINVSDNLNLEVSTTTLRNVELSSTEAVSVGINDYNGLSKPEYVNDSIDLTLLEKLLTEILHTSDDELLVTDKFYLPLGFNQQGFNQSQDRYFEKSEKTTRDNFINVSDNLSTIISSISVIGAEIHPIEDLKVNINDYKKLNKPEDVNDNLSLTIQESANVKVYSKVEDNLDIVYDYWGPLGFNQQGFNQESGEYLFSGENSEVGLFQSDSASVVVNDSSGISNKIQPIDELNLYSVAGKKWSKVTMSTSDKLQAIINETRALDKPEFVNDKVDINIIDDSSLNALFEQSDSVLVSLLSNTRVASTLMYLIDGKWRRIKVSYVLVNGEWRKIIDYKGVKDGQWIDWKK